MKNLTLFLGVALSAGVVGVSGCETIVDVDAPPHVPRLALSYTLSNSPAATSQSFFSVRNLFVSTSQGVLETKEPRGRGDAIVQLFDDSGQLVELFRSKAQPGYSYSGSKTDSVYGNYVPVRGFAGVPGRTYTLRASAPGVAAVEATLTLPPVPVIESAGYVAQPGNPNGGGGYTYNAGRLSVSIADNAATTDYYLTYARVLDRQGNYWGNVARDYNRSGTDINLSRLQLSEPGSSYGQYPYSDAGSNGQRVAFGTDVRLFYQGGYNPNNPTPPEPGYLEVIVSSITPDTYRFYQSLGRYYDTDGNPFAEPAPLHSNIRPGYGLFGGATDVVYRIKL
ncbi:DUF4249 domain-containing protein [Hymenobacter rubripertinctus]|uniref:DUF4249 domain-containing protein n=1 Tax=Hymenobacter rubripertinctus TaxID=2029981 RepID=A0A418QZ01_9BACT|nr:DUF4249 domain-containing protein [Hymenobacter rubripertinctus]RIY10403.1 DUF4249 domain-containing protein [Hymenobacter rubripertinctus]